MRNMRQLGDFLAYWRSSPEYPPKNDGNDHIYLPVHVVYQWGNGKSKIRFSSTFRVSVGSGPNDGDIDIDDTDKVKVEDFHLRFKADFQTYQYDDTIKSLVISGNSPKMGGEYKVIIPTIHHA